MMGLNQGGVEQKMWNNQGVGKMIWCLIWWDKIKGGE